MQGLRRFNFFVDLDGVLADFNRGFMEMCGSTLPFRDTDEEAAWDLLKRTPNFWRRLHPMPGAMAFWESLKEYNPCILTSPSTHDTDRAIVEKRQWVDNWLGKSTPVFFRRSRNKYLLASPDAILIDDYPPNIEAWRKAGGHGILHASIQSTQEQLSRMADLPDIHSYIRIGA